MSDNATPVPSPEQPHEVDKSDINDNGDTNSELEGDNDMHADLHEDLNDEMDTKIPALGLHPRPGSEDNSLTDPSYNRSHSEAIDTVDRSRGHQNRDNNMEIREYDMRGAEGNNVDRESEAPNRHRRSLPTRNHRPRNFDFGAPALRDQGDADHPGFRRDRGRGAGNPDASNEEPVRPPVKVRKKPGPPKTVAPPIKKNDLDAKMALIREIEGHWGKDFIKTYVPKIHRPLVKRRQGKPRSINRKVEDKPMHWTPSVLKALLMIAKICDDKVKLKKIMGDVVRYRNQHTGNKKPQLVTTDFDVIEDILLKGWPVETSFGIRYKHLLQHRLDGRTDTQEKNDYYKHLFRDSDYSDEDGDDEEKANEDDDDTDAHGGLSNEFQLQSGYYEPPAQTSNLQYDDEHEQEPSIQVKRGRNYLHDMQMDLNNAPPNVNDRYGYGSKNPRHPPRTGAHVQPEVHYHNMNGNKRYGGSAQIPYNEMASRGMKTLDPYTHGRHHDDFLGGDDGKVAAYKRGRGRAGDFRQSHNGKFAYKQNNHDRFREPDSPTSYRRHDRFPRRSMESTPEKPITNVRIKQTQSRQPSSPTMVKTEPGEELPALSTTQNRHGGRSNFSASASNVNDMDIDMDEEDPEYIRAQIEVDEAQARAAKRRMKLMEIERRNHRLSGLSGTPGNPVHLE